MIGKYHGQVSYDTPRLARALVGALSAVMIISRPISRDGHETGFIRKDLRADNWPLCCSFYEGAILRIRVEQVREPDGLRQYCVREHRGMNVPSTCRSSQFPSAADSRHSGFSESSRSRDKPALSLQETP